jgi:hypothetical protein
VKYAIFKRKSCLEENLQCTNRIIADSANNDGITISNIYKQNEGGKIRTNKACCISNSKSAAVLETKSKQYFPFLDVCNWSEV